VSSRRVEARQQTPRRQTENRKTAQQENFEKSDRSHPGEPSLFSLKNPQAAPGKLPAVLLNPTPYPFINLTLLTTRFSAAPKTYILLKGLLRSIYPSPEMLSSGRSLVYKQGIEECPGSEWGVIGTSLLA